MPDHRDALVPPPPPPPPPPQDEAWKRWTRPMIRELGRVQGTESGPHVETFENDTYRDVNAS